MSIYNAATKVCNDNELDKFKRDQKQFDLNLSIKVVAMVELSLLTYSPAKARPNGDPLYSRRPNFS